MTPTSDQIRLNRQSVPLTSHLPHPVLRAGNGTRTRDPNLGKVVLYQLSYSRRPSKPVHPVHPSIPSLRPPFDPTSRPPDWMEARGIEPLTS